VLRQHRVAVPGKSGTDGYRNEYAAIALGFGLLGATHAAIAELLGIDANTITDWKRAHPKFRKALDEGAKYADAFVAAALYKRCVGLTVVTRTTETRTGYDTAGNVTGTVESVTVETKEILPDATACWRWLGLRQRWYGKPKLTIEEVYAIIEAARAEAKRRGIDFESALPAVQERQIPRCPHCGGPMLRLDEDEDMGEDEEAALSP
jgi:hypothetical protein